jgi:hypothetical protein
VVLGCLLVVMGAAQMWLRWGPWAKEQQQAEEALARRRAEAAGQAVEQAEAGCSDEEGEASEPGTERLSRTTAAGTKLWNKWTAILGPLGIALGLFLLLWGIFAG